MTGKRVYGEGTTYPCWFCADNNARSIRLEEIVPMSYRKVYVKKSRCMCNYARLCRNCTRLWRIIQYRTMLELADKYDAPLQTQKNGIIHSDSAKVLYVHNIL